MTRPTGGVVDVIELDGEFDMSAVPAVRHAILHADRPVVLDLSKVGFIDSPGIGTLASLRHRIVGIRAASPAVRRLLALTGVDDLLDLAHVAPEDDTRSAGGAAGG